MKINGMVHCFFEQSGTFKNEFKKLGIHAEDYDIQNHFGETDHVIDLFHEIDEAYKGGASIFDNISKDDFIMAFYPCIFFSCVSAINFTLGSNCFRGWDAKKIGDYIINRSKKRSEFFERLNRFCIVCLVRDIRMAFENPWSENHFLKSGFLKSPDIVDNNRSQRGDFRIKPTAYWFFNCEPTHAFTFDKFKGDTLKHVKMKSGLKAGLCSEERSMISPIYAHNFICDFILGKPSKEVVQQADLFD